MNQRSLAAQASEIMFIAGQKKSRRKCVNSMKRLNPKIKYDTMYPREKGKNMKESWENTWYGTIAELREWLDKFDDDKLIVFCGGSDGGYEFLRVYVDGNVEVNC